MVLPLLIGGGCYDSAAYDELVALTASREASSSTGALDPGVTASATGESGDGSSTDGSSTSGGVGQSDGGESHTGGGAGLDVSLSVAPELLYQAGLVTLSVDHDDTAVLLELWDEIDPEKPQLTWTPDEPAPNYLITRGGSYRSLTVRAYDEQGNMGVSNVAKVALQLPSPGATLWEETIELGSVAQGRAVTAGFLKGDLSIVAGLDSDNRAIVGRYSPVGEPALHTSPASPVSTTTGVAIMPDGWVLAAGVDVIGLDPRSWLARVNPYTGEIVTLHQGKLGDAVTGLAVDLELGRAYMSGYSTPQGKAAPDARIWAWSFEGGDLVWTRVWERPVDDPNNVGKPSDRGLAVAVLDNHDPVLVGQSTFVPNDPDDPTEYWAFVHRYDSNGVFNPNSKSWTSPEIFKTAGAYAVARDDDNGLLVAGWTSQDPKTSRQATILAFDELLSEAEVHHHGLAGSWNAKGVIRLTTGEIVYLADADIDDEGRHDFEVRAIDSFFGTATWTKLVAGEKGARAAGLTVTPEGHIVIIGTSIRQNGTSMILEGLHP